MTNQEIKEVIENLKEMSKGIVIAETTVKDFRTATEIQMFDSNNMRIQRYKKALQFAIQFLPSINDAKMPKKKSFDCMSEPAEQCLVVEGFNKCYDLWLAYHLKKMRERVDVERIVSKVLQLIIDEFKKAGLAIHIERLKILKKDIEVIQSELFKKE